MTSDIKVKICGLTRPEHVHWVAAAGAAYAGFVFFARSPRHVTVEAARALALEAPVGLAKVALVVDAEDAALDAIHEAVPLDMLQLHGHETPDRVAAVRVRYGLPVGLRSQQFHPRQLSCARQLRHQRRAHRQTRVRCAGHGDRDEGDEELRRPPAVALARPSDGLAVRNRSPIANARRNHAASTN